MPPLTKDDNYDNDSDDDKNISAIKDTRHYRDAKNRLERVKRRLQLRLRDRFGPNYDRRAYRGRSEYQCGGRWVGKGGGLTVAFTGKSGFRARENHKEFIERMSDPCNHVYEVTALAPRRCDAKVMVKARCSRDEVVVTLRDMSRVIIGCPVVPGCKNFESSYCD